MAREFGRDALRQCFSDNAARPLDEMLPVIRERLAEHQGEAPRTDDVTLLAMEIL